MARQPAKFLQLATGEEEEGLGSVRECYFSYLVICGGIALQFLALFC